MKRLRTFIILCALLAAAACGGGEEKPATPLDALKSYTQAIKKKDAARMRSLLSKGSLKMVEEEARAQKLSPEEIIKRETLFSEGQKTFKFRNERIEGDTASIEFEDALGNWDTVFFVRENGAWKIAKDRYAEEMLKKSEEKMRELDEQINR